MSLVGVALGVAALIVVIGVMEGLETKIRSIITASHSHIVLYSQAGLIKDREKMENILYEKFPEIEAISPFLSITQRKRNKVRQLAQWYRNQFKLENVLRVNAE